MRLVNIDVTLRDGGYRNGFGFPLDYALKHARLSVEAGFDWVEIAYRKGSFAPMDPLGITGRGEDDYIEAMADEIGPDHVGMILHPKNITEGDLPAMYRAGARLVRFCLPADAPETGLDQVRQAKEVGFTVSVNLTRVSQLSVRHIVTLAEASAEAGADVLYLADSNGSLTPKDASNLIALTSQVFGREVGLHAHNNLGLALTNAISALESGATWMDSAVQGMGKGPGNLVAEQWLAYLQRNCPEAGHFELAPVLELADLLLDSVVEAAPSLPLPDLLLGQFDLSVEHHKSVDCGHRRGVMVARRLTRRPLPCSYLAA